MLFAETSPTTTKNENEEGKFGNNLEEFIDFEHPFNTRLVIH